MSFMVSPFVCPALEARSRRSFSIPGVILSAGRNDGKPDQSRDSDSGDGSSSAVIVGGIRVAKGSLPILVMRVRISRGNIRDGKSRLSRL
jgi:hypothetical protein